MSNTSISYNFHPHAVRAMPDIYLRLSSATVKTLSFRAVPILVPVVFIVYIISGVSICFYFLE